MPPKPASRLNETYLELLDDGGVEGIPLTPEFWPDLMSGRRRIDGRLIMSFELAEDMSHWEMHPAGDEILLALSGSMAVVLQGVLQGDPDESFALRTGEAFVVPRGRWHRLNVIEPGEVVFITPGDGTEHKSL